MINYYKLNEKEIPYLLKTISMVLKETGAHDSNISKTKSWNWQYKHLPSLESHIYVAKYNDTIIGYYHIPTYLFNFNNKIIKIGQIQTVAILKEYRGKGVFQKLAEFANKDINSFVDIIYTFPNDKSIHTFLKYNDFKLVGSLPVYILPTKSINIVPKKYKYIKSIKILWNGIDSLFKLFSKKLNKTQSLKVFDYINKDVENLFLNFSKDKKSLVRNKTFLEWRYYNSPKGEHKIIGLIENDTLESVVIIKKEKIFSTNGYIVMDFAFSNYKKFTQLLTNLHTMNKINENEISFIFISGFNEKLKKLKYSGFIPIPQKLIPRKLNLLARWTGKKNKNILPNQASWLITVGDWDVF